MCKKKRNGDKIKKEICNIVEVKTEVRSKAGLRTEISDNAEFKKKLVPEHLRKGVNNDSLNFGAHIVRVTPKKCVTTDGNGSKHADSHPCPECDTCFSGAEFLQYHFDRHHGGHRPYGCSRCSKKFKTTRTLKDHVDVIHMNIRRRRFTCDLCERSVSKVVTLVQHIATHMDKEKQFTDSDGNKMLAREGSKAHAGDFPCADCSMRFALVSRLRVHRRTHRMGAVKPYRCGECGASFSSNNNLRCHRRRHTGERPYACAHCGKHFSNPSNRKHHERTAHAQ